LQVVHVQTRQAVRVWTPSGILHDHHASQISFVFYFLSIAAYSTSGASVFLRAVGYRKLRRCLHAGCLFFQIGFARSKSFSGGKVPGLNGVPAYDIMSSKSSGVDVCEASTAL
jgi:hypothetical protein